MITFPCTECRNPVRLDAVAGWLAGLPFCSPPCLSRGEARDAAANTPSPIDLASMTIAHIQAAGEQVRGLIEFAQRAEVSGSRGTGAVAGVAGWALGGPIGGLLMHSAAKQEGVRSFDALQTQLWDIEQKMGAVVRHAMALHAAGYAVPPPLMEAVQLVDGLVGAGDAAGVAYSLSVLFEKLREVNDVVRLWQAQLGG